MALTKGIDGRDAVDLATVRHALGQKLAAAERERRCDDCSVPVWTGNLLTGEQKVDWIERRRELFRLADLDAEALVRIFGKAAYGEARRNAREARNRTCDPQDRPDGH